MNLGFFGAPNLIKRLVEKTVRTPYKSRSTESTTSNNFVLHAQYENERFVFFVFIVNVFVFACV